MLKVTVVLCTLVVATLAAQAIAPLDVIPDKFKTREGCYIEEHDKVLKVGESIPAKYSCTEYSCAKQYVTITGCGVVVAKTPCVTTEAKGKPYPKCCPTIKCP